MHPILYVLAPLAGAALAAFIEEGGGGGGDDGGASPPAQGDPWESESWPGEGDLAELRALVEDVERGHRERLADLSERLEGLTRKVEGVEHAPEAVRAELGELRELLEDKQGPEAAGADPEPDPEPAIEPGE